MVSQILLKGIYIPYGYDVDGSCDHRSFLKLNYLNLVRSYLGFN